MEFLQKIRNKYTYLSEEKILEIIGKGEIIVLKEGEIFVKAGDRSQKAGLVLEGLMRNYITNANGEEITVVFATEMQPITPYSTVLLNQPASETSAAIEPSTLFVMDYGEFKKNINVDPVYTRLYAEMLEASLRAAVERIEDFTRKKPEERYKRLLEIHGHLIERVPLKYLASYLGITAVSLSRIRKRLSKNRN
jgi:CRP-like cAMP-binding protein